MKSTKENPCAIPDTPDTYDDICIPGGKDFSILTPAVRTKLPNTGEDAYTARALMYNGAQYLGGGYLAFELRWNLPAGGVNAIEWEHPDSVMPTNGIFYPCRHLLAPDNVNVPAPNGGTYLALTDNFLNNIKDDRASGKSSTRRMPSLTATLPMNSASFPSIPSAGISAKIMFTTLITALTTASMI